MIRIFKRRKLRRALRQLGPFKNERCDYFLARDLITKQWSGGVLKKDLIQLLDAFVQNPCEDRAVDLLMYDPDLIAFFDLARKKGTLRY